MWNTPIFLYGSNICLYKQKVQSEPPSGNHNNLESKDKTKEDELGSVDHGSDDYDELDLDDEFTDSDMDGEYEKYFVSRKWIQQGTWLWRWCLVLWKCKQDIWL